MKSDSEYLSDPARHTETIIASNASKKLIVAGPGTGKTHTFKELLKSMDSNNSLVITFIRTLVEDLDRSLKGLARVSTFHGYCKNLLLSNPAEGLRSGVDYYPAVLLLISADMACLGTPKTVEAIERHFYQLKEDEDVIGLALKIGNYYNAVGHVDAVYRVLAEIRSGRQKPEVFQQVVVDEYQDFNRLEVEFIAHLATVNRVLIAGDDDQAVYSFRQASAAFLRSLQLDKDTEFESFELPYCSRCPEAVIKATRVVIHEAQKMGLLKDRLNKPLECFVPDKREDNEAYPSLVHAHCSIQRSDQPYMAYYIREQIEAIPSGEVSESRKDGFPTVLVIGPNPFLRQIAAYLEKHFEDVELRKSDDYEVDLLDGYLKLLKKSNSRLGWRIVLERDPVERCCELIQQAIETDADIVDLLPRSYVEKHFARVKLLTNLRDGEEIDVADRRDLEVCLGRSLDELLLKLGVVKENETGQLEDLSELTRIVLTTSVSSKGLQAQHVFLVGVNENHFPKRGRLTDEKICGFLVSLTRTRKACHLLSCGRFGKNKLNKSIFTKWLSASVQSVYVDKNYVSQLEMPSGRPL